VEKFHTVKLLMLAASFCFVFATCAHRESQAVSDERIKKDHAEIAAMLDRALLSATPIDSIKSIIADVRSYPSVDSAWLSGSSFFVKYKKGGIVSWTVPTPIH
jgi:hypothetical protein